ncbi:MAG: Lrp/AsnC family transcriptional regulator [Bacteroidota bacterium]
MKQLDAIDKRILNILQDNGKLTNKEIAARLGMTVTPVYERIKKLEEYGFIQKYVALIDTSKLGFQLVAFCNVSLKEHSKAFLSRFEEEIKKFDEVITCYHIAGQFDYLLKVVIKDMEAYQNFIVNKLASLENIGNVQSSFVMTDVKSSTAVKLFY